MCGIAGVWQAGSALQVREAAVAAMLHHLRHRGPDDKGQWSDPAAGVTLGHRRLAILDLSPRAHQPMVVGDGRPCAIVFNGEIYNFRDLRAELETRGERFHSESDTEVLLRGYLTWGTGVLDRLVGMFAFAIWDGTRQELFVARDRAGEKPLYYTATQGRFAFASELDALTAVGEFDRRISAQAVSAYLQVQCVPAPLTIYTAASKLPPGHAMVVNAAGIARWWRYWDPVAVVLSRPSTSHASHTPSDTSDTSGDARHELEALLDRAVRLQMIADVPVGAFLSGGIDSSVIIALMMRHARVPVKTFTIGFETAGYNEAPFAAAVAKHLGTEHTAETLSPARAFELITRLPTMYGEPFADASALPTHLVSVLARREVTVALTGNGGDELFGGYKRYAKIARYQRLARVGQWLGSWLPSAWRHRLSWVRANYLHRMTFFSPHQAARLTGVAQPIPEFDRAWLATERLTLPHRARVVDFLHYLPESVLVKDDRASMAVALETRSPMLDHRVIEFGLGVTGPLVQNKRLLRELAYRFVPRQLLDRPKQGFSVPLEHWLRAELVAPLLDLVTPARMAALGLHGASHIRRLLAQRHSGRMMTGYQLWILFVLALWGRANGIG